jgi:hypothetical protein
MPRAIALRDSPHARCTSDTPPYASMSASLAAISRRARSSNIGQTDANFRRSSSSDTTVIPGHYTKLQIVVLSLCINGS